MLFSSTSNILLQQHVPWCFIPVLLSLPDRNKRYNVELHMKHFIYLFIFVEPIMELWHILYFFYSIFKWFLSVPNTPPQVALMSVSLTWGTKEEGEKGEGGGSCLKFSSASRPSAIPPEIGEKHADNAQR